jgi:DNA-binding PadR family transcriptional regulator
MTSLLKPTWFHVLLALADGPQHGYAIRGIVEERTDGAIKLWPVTLYGSIRQLEEKGLIAESGASADDDPRRRYYRLTPKGRAALSAETDRLAALVKAARTSRALRNA